MSASVYVVRAIASTLHGDDAAALLDLPAERLLNDDMHFSTSQVAAIVRRALDATGEPGLGLTVAGIARPSVLPILHMLLLSCPTLREAWAVVMRYSPLISAGMRCRLEDTPDYAVLSFEHLCESADVARFAADFTLAMAMRSLRQFSPTFSWPLEVRWRHPKHSYVSRYEELFGCPQHFASDTNALVIPREWLDASQPLADARLHGPLRALADEALLRSQGRVSVTDRVRTFLTDLPAVAKVDAALIARKAGVPPRSLRRHLEREGIRLSTLRDEVRRQRSCEALRDGWTVAEVAEAMGYSQSSAFYRAFKRWTGATPSSYRRARPGTAAGVESGHSQRIEASERSR